MPRVGFDMHAPDGMVHITVETGAHEVDIWLTSVTADPVGYVPTVRIIKTDTECGD